jgi:hypothetical protein
MAAQKNVPWSENYHSRPCSASHPTCLYIIVIYQTMWPFLLALPPSHLFLTQQQILFLDFSMSGLWLGTLTMRNCWVLSSKLLINAHPVSQVITDWDDWCMKSKYIIIAPFGDWCHSEGVHKGWMWQADIGWRSPTIKQIGANIVPNASHQYHTHSTSSPWKKMFHSMNQHTFVRFLMLDPNSMK